MKIFYMEEYDVDPFYTMALDEYLLNKVESGEMPGIFRFYTWHPHSISIGKFLKTDKLDLVKINKKNIPIVRRPTGGNAIYHHNDISYSFIIPKKTASLSTKKELYLFLADIFIKTLAQINITASVKLHPSIHCNNPDCFFSVSQYEIINNSGDKIIASAQKILKNSMLQQGSFFPPLSKTKLNTYLDEQSNKVLDKSILISFAKKAKKIFQEQFTLLPYKLTVAELAQINYASKEKKLEITPNA